MRCELDIERSYVEHYPSWIKGLILVSVFLLGFLFWTGVVIAVLLLW
jgi:hypothetical protein